MSAPADLGPGDLELAGVLEGSRAFIGPEQVVIDITNRCNNNCIGCWTRSPLLRDLEPSAAWQAQELAPEVVLRLLEDLHHLGTRRVRFTGGGEPLLYRALPQVLSRCRELGLITCITTNGTLLDEHWIELLTRLPVDELAVSLWAATPESYSRVHPNKTGQTFTRMIRALAQLCARREQRPRITLTQVLLAINYTEATAMVDQALELGVDALYFTLLDPVEDRTAGLLLSPAQAQELRGALEQIDQRRSAGGEGALELENWAGFKRRVDSIQGQSRGDYDREIIDEAPCTVGWIFSRILADGDVVPCCRGSRMPLGNINRESFRAVWAGEDYRAFRDKARRLPKSDPFFHPIGCQQTCDNLMHIEMLNQRASSLTGEQHRRLETFIAERKRGTES